MTLRKISYYATILLGILICSGYSGCQENVESQLIGCWIDSYEENNADISGQIYRPCDYKVFPPSRFRFSVELKAAGICSYFELSPSDRHSMKEGTWRFDLNSMTVAIWSLKRERIKEFRVVEVQKNLLLLEGL